MSAPYLLVLYYSRTGTVAQLARQVAHGAERAGLAARLRTVPPVSPTCEATAPAVPDQGAPYCQLDDLRGCAALALGSPARYGSMAAPLKYFLEQTTSLWTDGALVDRPAGAFTASGTLHGGQEATLLSMLVTLLHHGMLVSGIPYTEPGLFALQGGGTPYGAGHVSGTDQRQPLLDTEIAVARSLGGRLARLALNLGTRS